MSLIRIDVNDDFIVDYDKERGMYRVSYFQDNHFQDEIWFNAYEDKEVDDGVYLDKEEYEELLEYKYMYEDLCS